MANSVISTKLRTLNTQLADGYFDNNYVYVFVGRENEWDDPLIPDTIIDSVQDVYQTHNSLFGLKRVFPTQIRQAIKRHDWSVGTVYDYYRDDVDLATAVGNQGGEYVYYVVTDELNVYKCLSNNNGAPSTTKPEGQLVSPFRTDDGYLWKYMYSVREVDYTDFVSPEWIPVYKLRTNDGSIQWIVQESAVKGSIEHIRVESSGNGYDRNNPPTVTIAGDGSGCTATASVNINGQLESIEVTNAGQGYTFATVTITDPIGTGASATAIMSPYDGHGSDPVNELLGNHLLIYVEFIGDEGGKFPTTSYRQTGMLVNPLTSDTGTVIDVNQSRFFTTGETVTGSTSGATATIRYVDTLNDAIHVENITGVFVQGEEISNSFYNDTVISTQTGKNMILNATVASSSDIIPMSGEVIYVRNRTKVTRSSDQTESLQLVVNF